MSDLDALEFAAPPTVLSGFNRNFRKFRILQVDFGNGFIPIVVGTYSVDPTTGNPITSEDQPYSFVQVNVSNTDVTAIGKQPNYRPRIFGIEINLQGNVTTSNAIGLSSSGSSGVFYSWFPSKNFDEKFVFLQKGFLAPDLNSDVVFKTSAAGSYLGALWYI